MVGEMVHLLLAKIMRETLLITDRVIVSMDFMLTNHNLNLIGPANILAWATNCWQHDVPFLLRTSGT